MSEKYTFTLLVFCKIFGLSYSVPQGETISKNHILNLFNYNDNDTKSNFNAGSFCNAIKGKGQLQTRIKFINTNNKVAFELMNGLNISTLHYVYRMVTHKKVADNDLDDLVYEILQASMQPDRKAHEESISYPESYIESFKYPDKRDSKFTSDESLEQTVLKLKNTISSELISPAEYCETNGIIGFSDDGLSMETIRENLINKDTIYILATTGLNLILKLASDFLADMLLNGTNFIVLIPNKYSSFVNDVADIESPYDKQLGRNSFAGYYQNVISTLKREVIKSESLANGRKIGTVHIGCSFTLLRQTILLGVKEDEIWGWQSLTMPPSRTITSTTSFAFSGVISDKSDSIAKRVYTHVLAILNESKHRNSVYLINKETDENIFNFGLEKANAKQYWEKLYQKAKLNMIMHNQFKGELIEVAANHPLVDGQPSSEFKSRLDYASLLYKRLTEQGKTVKIYVPGSLHMSDGIVDNCSLSQAGKEYLVSIGVDEESIMGNEMNIKYKGEEGVYNSADECFVATQIYNEYSFCHLHTICSQNQALRKQLFYIAFGVVPFVYTVPSNVLAHDFIFELFEAVPNIIYYDHTWQDKDSSNGNRTRNERRPKN
ncbi:MAG: hypothetical protein IKG82_09320 [Oscillospiraceae bacterium]|nr:hypothetical protein [Oscillospiraceae bacterium]